MAPPIFDIILFSAILSTAPHPYPPQYGRPLTPTSSPSVVRTGESLMTSSIVPLCHQANSVINQRPVPDLVQSEVVQL